MINALFQNRRSCCKETKKGIMLRVASRFIEIRRQQIHSKKKKEKIPKVPCVRASAPAAPSTSRQSHLQYTETTE
jgi:hypothetical protein